MSASKASSGLLALAGLLLGCNAVTFDPQSKIESVRILAMSADRPYAAPGDVVTMNVLAVDGRPAQPAPMNVGWLTGVCFDPPGDAFYACFPGLAHTLQSGVDLGAALAPGTSFSFTMPSDVISSHANTSGGTSGATPYGLAVVFAVACAGQVRYVPTAPGGSPDAVPFGCFDGAGRRLGADDFVFAYSLVYSFADRTNANPVIQGVTFGGSPVDPVAGIAVDHCTKSNNDDCPTSPINVVVPAAAQEVDPGDLDVQGNPLREQIYVDCYLTAGKVKNDTVVLFDPRAGRLSDTGDDFSSPQAAGDSRLWVVVHDNRGGVVWQDFPILAR